MSSQWTDVRLDSLDDETKRKEPETGSKKSLSMQDWIDGALYPDTEPPEALETLADRVDFLARLCGAWDFGILPYEETVEEIKRPEWREAVDACQMLTSVAYQILRDWHDLPPVPYIGREFDYINEDPFLEHI